MSCGPGDRVDTCTEGPSDCGCDSPSSGEGTQGPGYTRPADRGVGCLGRVDRGRTPCGHTDVPGRSGGPPRNRGRYRRVGGTLRPGWTLSETGIHRGWPQLGSRGEDEGRSVLGTGPGGVGGEPGRPDRVTGDGRGPMGWVVGGPGGPPPHRRCVIGVRDRASINTQHRVDPPLWTHVPPGSVSGGWGGVVGPPRDPSDPGGRRTTRG